MKQFVLQLLEVLLTIAKIVTGAGVSIPCQLTTVNGALSCENTSTVYAPILIDPAAGNPSRSGVAAVRGSA